MLAASASSASASFFWSQTSDLAFALRNHRQLSWVVRSDIWGHGKSILQLEVWHIKNHVILLSHQKIQGRLALASSSSTLSIAHKFKHLFCYITIYITPSFDTVDSSSEVEMKHPLQLGTSKMHFFLEQRQARRPGWFLLKGDSQEICRPRSINLWLYNYFKVLKTSIIQCFWGPQRFLFLSLISKIYRILSLQRTIVDRNQSPKDRPGGFLNLRQSRSHSANQILYMIPRSGCQILSKSWDPMAPDMEKTQTNDL